MNIAIWIIAICELIRLVQNCIQLVMMKNTSAENNIKRATDEFIKSMNKTDEQFWLDMWEQLKEQKND